MTNEKHYAFIPRTTLTHEKYRALKKNARLLYIYMAAKRAGIDDWFSYSYKEIRADSGYRYATISDSIRRLSIAEFLKYEHGGLELNHNRYYLEPSWLEI